MALKNFCGFELNSVTGGIERFGGVGESGEIQAAIKRTGNYALRYYLLGGNNGAWDFGDHSTGGYSAVLNLATAYYRFYFYVASAPPADNEEFAGVLNGSSTYKLSLRLTSARKIQIYDSAGSQLGSDGTTVLALNTWYKFTVKCGTGGSAAYEIKINDVVELSGTGNLGTGNNDRLFIGKMTNRNNQNIDYYYDDIAIADSDYPNSGGVLCLVPNGDGTYTTWTIGAGTGNDWEQVDEIPYDDNTTYLVSTGIVGEASTVTLVNTITVGIVEPINAVKMLAIIAKNAPQTAGIKLRIRSGSTNSDSAGFAITNTPGYQAGGYLLATDPNTSAAWTTAGLDAAEIGVVENDTDKTSLTALYLIVDVVNPPTIGNIYTYAVEWEDGGTLLGSGQPLGGDRAAYDVLNYDTLHGADIAAETLKRHLPNPSGEDDGNIAYIQSSYWVVGPITDIFPNNGLAALFLYNDASTDPATYKQMLPDHSTAAKETISVASLTDGTVIEEFISDISSPGADFLLDGIYHVHIHAAKTAGTKVLKIYAEIYIRTYPDGVETLLGTTSISNALTAEETAYDLDLALADIDISLSDRMVVKIVADVTGSGTNPTGALYVEGDTFSRFEFPAIAIADATIDSGSIRSITFIIDGGGSAITTGVKGDLEIPFTCTINRATLLADQSGSIVIDIWKDTYANYPPTDADSITASTPPTLSGAIKSQDSTLTGWNIVITAGDTLRFNVDSATTVTRVTLSLKVTKIDIASLTVQNGSHTHTAESITLVQHNVLIVQNGSHTHTAESIALGLDIQDGSHTHTADSPTLS